MNILMPWNTSYFIPLNAFHPLYGAFSQSSNKEIRYIIPRRNLGWEQYRGLYERGVYNDKFNVELWWLRPLTNSQRKKFYDFFSLREINYVDKLPRDIEFLHTAPITSGNNDFVIHCESFLPFFMPFFNEGIKVDARFSSTIRQAYGDLLRVRCKAIVSHSKKTLNELSDFFNCTEIDKLLNHLDIGVTRKANIPSTPVFNNKNDIIFLFQASASNTLNNFHSRGGIVSIIIALDLISKAKHDLKINKSLKFIFRSPRPDDDFFKKSEVNIEALHNEELKGNIIWVEHRLSQVEVDNLMSSADFLLMLGASLHSDAIISAMRSRATPVILDSPDYEIYVDGDSAIVINGIYKDIVNQMDILKLKKTFEDYDKYIKIQDKIVKKTINSIAYYLAHLDKVFFLQENALNLYLSKFNGEIFLTKFESLLLVFDNDQCNFSGPNNPLPLGEAYIEDIDKPWFETSPHPIVFANYGHGIHRKVFKQYLYTPWYRDQELVVLESFSILHFIYEKYNYSDKSFFISDDLHSATLGMIDLQSKIASKQAKVHEQHVVPVHEQHVVPVLEVRRLSLKSRVSAILINYPRLHGIAYSLYKAFK